MWSFPFVVWTREYQALMVKANREKKELMELS